MKLFAVLFRSALRRRSALLAILSAIVLAGAGRSVSAEDATVPHDASLSTVLSAKDWLNGAPSASDVRGKVVLVDVFTFDCFNCQNITPNLRELARTKRDGLVIIGIHSPETPVEHERDRVVSRLSALGITWPVAIDNDFRLWNAYRIAYWPTQMIFDRRGALRRVIIGDSQDAAVDATVNALLREPALVAPASADHASVHDRGNDVVRARLVLPNSIVATGAATAMTVELTPAPGWHLYGPERGDAGVPPNIAWTLPAGGHAGAIDFPRSRRVDRRGVTTYEYDGRTILRIPLTIATTAHPSAGARIVADVSWVACSNVCAPGRVSLSRTVAIVDHRVPRS